MNATNTHGALAKFSSVVLSASNGWGLDPRRRIVAL